MKAKNWSLTKCMQHHVDSQSPAAPPTSSLELGCVIGHAQANVVQNSCEKGNSMQVVLRGGEPPTADAVNSKLGAVSSRCLASQPPGPFFIEADLRVSDWNSTALFGSISGNHEKQHERYKQHLRLSTDNDINCTQETHGNIEDLASLRKDLRDHLYFGSFCNIRPPPC